VSALTLDEMVRLMVAQGVPKDRAERVAREEIAQLARGDDWRTPLIVPPPVPYVFQEAPRRWPLELTVPYPPRTKKNGTTLGVKQSVQYRRYARQVKEWAPSTPPSTASRSRRSTTRWR
jgi:hypothetical protein